VESEVVSAAPVESEVVSSAPVESEVVSSAPVESEVVSSAPVESEVVSEAPVVSEAVISAPVVSEAVISAPVLSEIPGSEIPGSEIPGSYATYGSKAPADSSSISTAGLIEGEDYEVVAESSILKATDPGKYTITIKGINGYTGTATVEWTITSQEDDDSDEAAKSDVKKDIDTDKPATIDKFKNDTVAKIGSDAIKEAADTGDAGLQISMMDTTVTFPKEMIDDLAKADEKVTVATNLKAQITGEAAADQYPGFEPAKDSNVQVFGIEITDKQGENLGFDGKVVKVEVKNLDDDIKKLGKDVKSYCVKSDEVDAANLPEATSLYDGDASDGTVGLNLTHTSEYALTSDIGITGVWHTKFMKRPALIVSSDKVYVSDERTSGFIGKFEEETDKEDEDGYRVMSANAKNSFAVTAPYIYSEGYRVVGWVEAHQGATDTKGTDDWNKWAYLYDFNSESGDVRGEQGATIKFADKVSGEADRYLFPVVEYLDEKGVTEISANGLKISIEYKKTPAYTGKKLKIGDIITSFKIDGKEIATDLIKAKAKGDKKVGSEVVFTLKSVKGLDKETNKQLKNKEIGKVKIRAIEVSGLTLFKKSFAVGTLNEGLITVSMKNGKVKKVNAILPKSWKFNKINGRSDQVARKLKVNKKTYKYENNYIKFDGTVLNGTVKATVLSQ
ncbi:MAG: hypothetical protein K6G84_03200, partial [Lachnospiraceae bacterium]|nr:hypothetical protein [Lachnospiraceae bacterium]